MIPSTISTNQKLAKVIERQNLLPAEVLDGLVIRARTLQEWLGQVAVDDGLLTYEELALAISRELRIPLVNISTKRPDNDALSMVPVEVCRTHTILPLNFSENVLSIILADPMDEDTLSMLRGIAGCTHNANGGATTRNCEYYRCLVCHARTQRREENRTIR